MFYQRYTDKSDNPKWGGATYFFETDKNDIPLRQLVVYENGKTGKYDEHHKSDEAGKLSKAPLFSNKEDKKDWRIYRIGKRSFEKAWRNPESVSTNPTKDALRSVRAAGTWAIILGLLTSVAGLVFALLALHDHSLSNAARQNGFALYIAVGVIPGMILNALGTLLRVTTPKTLLRAQKAMIAVVMVIFGVPLLNFFLGGNYGIGIIGFITLIFIIRARANVARLGITTSLQYRLTALATLALILLLGALALPHFKAQLDDKNNSAHVSSANSKPAKRFAATAAASKNLAVATSVEAAQQALQSFANQYNLKIQINNVPASSPDGKVRFTALTNSDLGALKTYGNLWIDEWGKYPQDWVKHSKVQTVFFVKDVASDGAADYGSADPGNESLYYSVANNDIATHAAVHSTFLELVSYNDFNSFSPNVPNWTSYNPSGFIYGKGGVGSYCPALGDDPCSSSGHPLKGFVNDNAMTSQAADESGLYTYLMTTDDFHSLEGWLPYDKNLANKTQAMIGYLAHFSPEMQQSYFTDINQ